MSKNNTMKVNTKLKGVEHELNSYFVEREEVVHALSIAIITETNLLMLGPPGTAKSMIVQEWQRRIENAEYFEWLLTRFSPPEELFGQISLKGIEDDQYTRITKNKLPEAELAFLDEVFKSNSGLLNALLPVMNERKFYNDGKVVQLPLLTIVGASNEINFS